MTSLTSDTFPAYDSDIAGHLRERRTALFWPLSFVAVLFAHLVGGWWLLAIHAVTPVAPQPLPAIMMDLTPAPAAAPVPQPKPEPPKPVQPVFQSMPHPPTPQVQAPEVAPEKPLPQVPAEVALPQPVKKVAKPAPKPKPVKPVKKETPPPVPTPPAQAKPQPVAATPAPATPQVDTAAQQQKEAALAAASLAAKSNWYGEVVQHIAKFKRMPRARLRGPMRTIVSFEISRDGKLLSQHVLQSSGRDEIDDEAIAWIQRADPMPKPPAEISDADLSHGFTIPVDFNLPR